MTLVKAPLTLIILVASLLRANNLGLIDNNQLERTLAELYFQPHSEFSREALIHRFPNFDHFVRPAGPLTVTIQVGHLLPQGLSEQATTESVPPPSNGAGTFDVPLELQNLGRHGGAKVGSLREVDLNQAVAERIRSLLIERGYRVNLLPAIIPAEHYADAFIAIHADLNDSTLSGFLISEPAVDYSGRGEQLSETIARHYWKSTGLLRLPYASEAMTRYYAFNWSHFKRAIHPATPAVIIELGNLNNVNDLTVMTIKRERVAKGIADGIQAFLRNSSISQR